MHKICFTISLFHASTCFEHSCAHRQGVKIVLYSLSIFILVINQLDAQNLFYNKFISSLYMFRAQVLIVRRSKIVLYSLSTFILVINQLDAQNLFYNKFIPSLYMFRAQVLIVRRSKLYYIASGIITLRQVSGLKLLK